MLHVYLPQPPPPVQVSDPSHSSYAQYLPLAEINTMLMPSREDIDAATEWMTDLCSSEITLDVDTLHCDTSITDAGLMTPPQHLHPVIDFVHKPKSPRNSANSGIAGQHNKPNPKFKTSFGVAGTPTLQRKLYGIPEDLKGSNKTNLQMVWGPGTFGVNLKELQEFYTKVRITSSPFLCVFFLILPAVFTLEGGCCFYTNKQANYI